MHEFGLCEGIVETVERRAVGRPVAVVRVRAGAMHRVVEDSMQSAFALVSAGTVADGAQLELVVVPVLAHCRDCGLEVESDDPLAICTRCGGTDLELRGGDELVLESIALAADTEGVVSHVPRHSG